MSDYILLKICILLCLIFDTFELKTFYFWFIKPVKICLRSYSVQVLLNVRSKIGLFIEDWIDYGLYILALGICRLFDLLKLAFLIQLLTISSLFYTIGLMINRICCYFDEDMCRKSCLNLYK